MSTLIVSKNSKLNICLNVTQSFNNISKLLNQIKFIKLKLNKWLFTISLNWLMFNHYTNLLLTGAVQLHVLNNTSFLMAPVLRMSSVRRVSGLPPDQTGPQYLTANVSILYLTLPNIFYVMQYINKYFSQISIVCRDKNYYLLWWLHN